MNNLDITDELLLEELKKRFEHKRKAIEELQGITQELESVNNKLKSSEALKSHFIANINNEIVNPFASVLGLSRSIMLVKENDWERVQRLAKLIFTEAFQLDFQLKNIFVAAEIEAGNIRPQYSNVCIKQVIEGIFVDMKSDLDAKHLTTVFRSNLTNENGDAIYFKTDPEKFKIIVANLVSNAIKFSKGAEIEVEAFLDGSKLTLSVKDYGIGISESNQKIIFDRFTRLDTGINSLNRGHGLGLSIVKALLEIFEGEIKIESKRGEGTTFIIVLNEPQGGEDIEDFSFEGNEVFFGTEEEVF